MPLINISNLVGQSLFAVQTVDIVQSDFTTIKKTVATGGYIGNIWSWVTGKDGKLYFMFYLTNNDYNNFNPSFVKLEEEKLSIPALPAILKKIQDEQDQKDKETKGLLSYYLDKYLPVLVIGATAAIVVPPLIRTYNSSKKINGMANNNAFFKVAIAAAILYVVTRKKQKNYVETALDNGSFGPVIDALDQPIRPYQTFYVDEPIKTPPPKGGGFIVPDHAPTYTNINDSSIKYPTLDVLPGYQPIMPNIPVFTPFGFGPVKPTQNYYDPYMDIEIIPIRNPPPLGVVETDGGIIITPPDGSPPHFSPELDLNEEGFHYENGELTMVPGR